MDTALTRPWRRVRRFLSREGFTLLETLMALVVIGLIVLAASTLADLLRVVESRSARAERIMDEVSAAKRVLRSVVTQASVQKAAAGRAGFVGDENGFATASTGPQSTALGGPVEMKLSTYPVEGGEQELRLSWTDPETGQSYSERVLTKQSRITFRYFGRDVDGDRSWLEEWADGDIPPEGVMLRLSPNNAEPPFDLVARLPTPLGSSYGSQPFPPSERAGPR